MIARTPHLMKNDAPDFCCESPDQDLEMEWMAKLGILPPDVDYAEASLNVGRVYRIPFIRERCTAKANAAGKNSTFGPLYEDEVLAELTEKEIEQLRQYVKRNPQTL